MPLELDAVVPDFTLPDTGGVMWSLDDGSSAPAAVIVFTCNHCPYALAWHDRLMNVARDYADRGVRCAAINSNDAVSHPRDSYEAMQARYNADPWPMPYLHDADQNVAHSYDAKTTPHVFVVDGDRRLRYEGAPDADYDDPAEDAAWLRAALDAVLARGEVEQARTKPVGCSIKWK